MAFKQPAATPSASSTELDFGKADDFATAARREDSTPSTRREQRDPNKCKALLKLPDEAADASSSSKMAIDTDGPSAGKGRPSGKQAQDPDPGATPADETSDSGFADEQPPCPRRSSPMFVLPGQQGANSGKPFDRIRPDRQHGCGSSSATRRWRLPVANLGPDRRIGEASIRVHEALQQQGLPDPCARRSDKGFCLKTRNSSVDENVLFFVFPGSKFEPDELTLSNINTMVKARALGFTTS